MPGTSSSTMPMTVTACDVRLTLDALTVDLRDGRSVTVPMGWYPRLEHGAPEERANWQFTGQGEGIHWPDLDEDVAVADLVAGRGSGESQESLQRWLASRAD